MYVIYYLIFFLRHIHIACINLSRVFSFAKTKTTSVKTILIEFFWTFLPFSTIIALHVQFLWIADLFCIYVYNMYIHIYTFINGNNVYNTWTGKNYESLHCCGKFAFTPDDTEERWMLRVFFFLFIIIVKTARRPGRVENLILVVRHDCASVCMQIWRTILIGISDNEFARGWGAAGGERVFT